jgi:hypothetical protein
MAMPASEALRTDRDPAAAAAAAAADGDSDDAEARKCGEFSREWLGGSLLITDAAAAVETKEAVVAAMLGERAPRDARRPSVEKENAEVEAEATDEVGSSPRSTDCLQQQQQEQLEAKEEEEALAQQVRLRMVVNHM